MVTPLLVPEHDEEHEGAVGEEPQEGEGEEDGGLGHCVRMTGHQGGVGCQGAVGVGQGVLATSKRQNKQHLVLEIFAFKLTNFSKLKENLIGGNLIKLNIKVFFTVVFRHLQGEYFTWLSKVDFIPGKTTIFLSPLATDITNNTLGHLVTKEYQINENLTLPINFLNVFSDCHINLHIFSTLLTGKQS